MPDLLDDMTEAQADAYLDAMARRNRWRFRIILGITALVIGVGALYFFERDIRRAWRDFQLSQIPEPTLDEGELLLTRVHARLLPMWAIHQSNAQDTRGEQRAQTSFTKLQEALSALPRARSMAQDLHNLVVEPEVLAENGDAILEVTKRWNQYMDKRGEPWWIDGNVVFTPKTSFFYIKTYKLLGDVQVHVDQTPYRARFAARADSTNVVESFLGHTSPHQDGAIILADRLYGFALRALWPLMDPEIDADLTPRERVFAPFIRNEATSLISADHLRRLQGTARARHTLESNIEAVRKRHSCGSTFSIREVPWDGMPDDEYDLLRSYAKRDTFSDCPSIKAEEAEAIINASEDLKAQDPSLRDAVGSLVAFASRGVSVHEARHAGDHDKADGFTQPLPCVPCEGRLGRSSRAEASAYLASFAHPKTGFTSFFQACGVAEQTGGPHARAMLVLLPKLGEGACDAPPKDLPERARALETEFFGRSEPITLPNTFPQSLELFSPPKAAR